MNRKLTALGLALAAATSLAQAQTAPATTTVNIYGLLDTGVEYLTNVGAAGSHLTRVPGLTGEFPSRLGFRGKEDLGGGLSAIFTLEMGMGIDAGTFNQGGRAWGRQAWVGLAGPWGTLTAGRNYTMIFWGTLDGDLLGPGAFGLGSIDSYMPNSRIDNSLAWKGTFSGVTLGATYSLGRDTVNAGPSPSGANCAGESATDSKACREWSAMIKYDSPTWGLALVTDQFHGGPGAFGNLGNSGLTDKRTSLNGYVKAIAGLKLVAGLIQRENDGAAPASPTNGTTRKSNLYWVGGAWTVSDALVLDAQIHRISFGDGGDSSTLSVLRGTYNLSKRTALYGQLGRMNNGPRLAISVSNAAAGGAPAAGHDQSGLMVGMRHSF